MRKKNSGAHKDSGTLKTTRPRPALAVAPGVEVSADGKVITIDGIRYDRDVFRQLADKANIGMLFRLIDNSGIVTVQLAEPNMHINWPSPAQSDETQ